MAASGHGERAAGAFYGRRRGKTLRASQARLVETLLPRLRIDIARAPPGDLGTLFAGPVRAVHLEIGIGGGERLIHAAAAAPDIGHIGVEPFVNGLAKALAGIAASGIANVRLFDEDATRLLDWLPGASLARVELLYPDPWPKRRHWKRRFVNRANLDRIVRVLRPGGQFRFASDIDGYVNWTLRHALAHPDLEWTAMRPADWREPWPGWVRTRYETKAIAAGRRPTYLTFMRR
ncbi:MAG: tRNA (guanine-N(7)-)-methyltransferase [Alphaproteobacteria bacterium]|nr:MAG: tRNA (guanine-N(7)-)-methyltransferase [Alphaproteobacteria bacterium]